MREFQACTVGKEAEKEITAETRLNKSFPETQSKNSIMKLILYSEHT